MDIEECDGGVTEQLEANEILEAELERELKLLAETETNLQEMTDELEELLRNKGQNLSNVAPELDVMKQQQQQQQQAAAGGEGGAGGGAWQKSADGKWSSGMRSTKTFANLAF
jgi:septal ring factor EnvC (AmiA/AmiB activator)